MISLHTVVSIINYCQDGAGHRVHLGLVRPLPWRGALPQSR